MQRSAFLKTAGAVFSALRLPVLADAGDVTAQFEEIERRTGGRLGVAVLDTGTGQRLGYRADERFPMCSTFKVALVAAVCSRTTDGSMKGRVAYRKADLLDYAPITSKYAARGYMALDDLCSAAIEFSDNTAANLLLREIGGPQGVDRYLHSIGDRVTRLDRTEPSLNSAIPGDPRDTTTPRAMLGNLRAIVLEGKGISAVQKSFIARCMEQCRTGDTLLRAGVPKSWTVLDKTGMGGPNNAYGASNTRNDIAILRRPNLAPLVVTVYLTGAKVSARERDAAIAAIGRLPSVAP